DTVQGSDFQTRHLLMALDSGEPYRVARGIAAEAVYAAASGGDGVRRTTVLVRKMQALAERIGEPHPLGMAWGISGVVAYLQGRFAEARDLCDRGERILRERCKGTAWDIGSAQIFSLG